MEPARFEMCANQCRGPDGLVPGAGRVVDLRLSVRRGQRAGKHLWGKGLEPGCRTEGQW